MKKALVVSFPRSGTHFLMNTLGLNFGYEYGKYPNLEPIGFNFWVPNNVHWVLTKIHKSTPKPICVKSHHDVWFFDVMMEDILEMYDVFYISRSMDDVFNSYCKHLNGLPWVEGPNVKNGNELKYSEPVGGMLRYQYRQYKNMAEKYLWHISGWKKTSHKDKIIYVTYEDLNEKFNETVDKIGERLNVKPVGYTRPLRDKNVVADGKVEHICL